MVKAIKEYSLEDLTVRIEKIFNANPTEIILFWQNRNIASIEKGKRLLEYYPRHTLLETVEESVAYMVEHQWFEKQK
jgi:nucleoside-diphosphate-sugar epimerase